MSHPLPLTGERTLPGVPGEEYWFARHEAAYRWIVRSHAQRLRDAVVVEAGSGEGYGADLLRGAGARLVVALEYDAASVTHAGTTYAGVRTARANLAAMPLAPASADVLVSLQVVEHLWDLRAFLRDCARILRPGGLLVVTTPNRPVFSPGLRRGEKPTNPFHVEELDSEQLHGLLAQAGLTGVDVRGLHHGTRIAEWEAAQGTGLVQAQVAAALESEASGGAAVSGAGKGEHHQVRARQLAEFVATVTVEDFVVGDADGAQDLLAVAVAP